MSKKPWGAGRGLSLCPSSLPGQVPEGHPRQRQPNVPRASMGSPSATKPGEAEQRRWLFLVSIGKKVPSSRASYVNSWISNKDQSHNITCLGREASGAPCYTYAHQALKFKVSSPLPDAWKWSGCCWGRRKGRLRRQMVSPIRLSSVSLGKATQGQEHRQKRSWCHQLQKPRWFKCLWQGVGPGGGKRLRKERSL